MKRFGNLFEKLVSKENLLEAHRKASKGKSHYREVKWVNANLGLAINQIQDSLINKTFKTSEYEVETAVKGDKLRTIHKLPYYPDRVVQHALVNVCKDFWKASMIRDTFQSIEGRGTTDCFRRVKGFIKTNNPEYAVKLDIVKFYPNVCTTRLIAEDPFKIKCKDTLWLLHEILLSLPFLPLGNHTSQFGGNLKLNPVDWYAKQELRVDGYFRYCDDIVFFAGTKAEAKRLSLLIGCKLRELGLSIKEPIMVKLSESYLDFVGFRINHDKVLLRKRLAGNFRSAARKGSVKSLPSYKGWCKCANAIRFYKRQERLTHENTIRYSAT